MKHGIVALALLGGAVVAGCGGSDGDDARRAAIAGVVDQRIVPAYAEASTAGDALRDEVSALCSSPTPAALTSTRTAWRRTMAAWRRTEAAAVGPVLQRRTLDYVNWPVNVARVKALIAGDTALTPLGVASVSSGSRGLGGMEVVLFAPGDPATITRGRRCAYLRATSGLIARELAGAEEGWTGTARPFAKVLTGGDVANPESPQDAVNMLVSRHVDLLEMMVDQELTLAASSTNPVDRRSLLNDGPAASAAADMANRLRGVRDAYAPIDGGSSLGALLDGTETRLVEQLDAAIATADAIAGPLSESDQLRAFAGQVRDIEVLVSTEVVSELGVTVGFSDNDGDSG
ncbi:MAG: imelysin family protein [Thermoleophilia bacterium]|nr:imelysin family protein [Thermoleophilia bacterium]